MKKFIAVFIIVLSFGSSAFASASDVGDIQMDYPAPVKSYINGIPSVFEPPMIYSVYEEEWGVILSEQKVIPSEVEESLLEPVQEAQ